MGCISRNQHQVFRTATAAIYVIAPVLQGVGEFGGCQSIAFYKVLVSMGSQGVAVVKDGLVSGCQPIVFGRVCGLCCDAVDKQRPTWEYYMFQNGGWAMRSPGGNQSISIVLFLRELQII